MSILGMKRWVVALLLAGVSAMSATAGQLQVSMTGTGVVQCSLSGTKSWSSCSSSISGTLINGQSTTVSNSVSGYTGSITGTCQTNGTMSWGTGTCNIVTCPTQTQSWSSCSGSVASANYGSSSTATNTVSGYTGSATYTCSASGTWSQTGGTCTSTACSATTKSWNGTASGCSGSLASTASGSSATASNTAAGLTGSATYSCSNGTWSQTGGTCTGNPCASGVMSWVGEPNAEAYAETCSAPIGATPSGSSATAVVLDCTRLGSATYSCSNGTWTLISGSCYTAGCL